MNEQMEKFQESETKHPKRELKVTAYLFFVLSIVLFFVLLSQDQLCFTRSISELALLPFLLSIIVSIVSFVKLKGKKLWIAFLVLLVFMSLAGMFSLQGGGPRSRDAKIKSDIKLIGSAQDWYYDDNQKYASFQYELEENYLGGYALVNPVTNEAYKIVATDDTWTIQTELFSNTIQICEQFGAKMKSYKCTASSGEEPVCEVVEK